MHSMGLLRLTITPLYGYLYEYDRRSAIAEVVVGKGRRILLKGLQGWQGLSAVPLVGI